LARVSEEKTLYSPLILFSPDYLCRSEAIPVHP
jgi:hypothetical protein